MNNKLTTLGIIFVACAVVAPASAYDTSDSMSIRPDPVLHEMREQTRIMEQAEQRRQTEFYERDMIERRQRYDEQLRREQRENDRDFNWNGAGEQHHRPKKRY